MTAPDRSGPGRAAGWPAALADALDGAAREVADLTRRLTAAWPDDHGREWAERLTAVRYALERDADDAGRLRRDVERVADEQAGPLLGGTAARRADDTRGVRLPRLDDRPDG